MRVIQTAAAMQRLALRARRVGQRIAFVPTMGYLHEGHVSLMRRARKFAGPRGLVVVSIYVNPTQFGPQEDLSRYPRDLKRDQRLCRDAKVDVLFLPSDAEMYPGKAEGRYSTYIVEERLTQRMEGASRPTHFRGVTTIVAKLFNLVLPDVAVFGAKDWQQATVVKRMAHDLNFPVRIHVAPTVREKDGLAMSSRNKYLSAEERPQALALWQAVQSARKAVRLNKAPLKVDGLRKRLVKEIQRQPAAKVDYIEFFHPETLEPLARVAKGSQMALAVFIGKTRLIDNARL